MEIVRLELLGQLSWALQQVLLAKVVLALRGCRLGYQMLVDQVGLSITVKINSTKLSTLLVKLLTSQNYQLITSTQFTLPSNDPNQKIQSEVNKITRSSTFKMLSLPSITTHLTQNFPLTSPFQESRY